MARRNETLATGVGATRPWLHLDLDSTIYPTDSVNLAAHALSDRLVCRVLAAPEGTVRVAIRCVRDELTAEEAESLFLRELGSVLARERVFEQTADLRRLFAESAFMVTAESVKRLKELKDLLKGSKSEAAGDGAGLAQPQSPAPEGPHPPGAVAAPAANAGDATADPAGAETGLRITRCGELLVVELDHRAFLLPEVLRAARSAGHPRVRSVRYRPSGSLQVEIDSPTTDDEERVVDALRRRLEAVRRGGTRGYPPPATVQRAGGAEP